MDGIEDGEVIGFEEGMCWLPSHVVDEALSDHNHTTRPKKDHFKHHHYRHRPKLPAERPPPLHSKPRPHHRPKYPTNWASGGSGMQAIFLDSGQRSCGTGVFLPPRAGNNFQSNKKPACSPVLLPSRVVQALNLNVHALGLQISPRQEPKNNSKSEDCNSARSKNGRDASTKCCVVSQNRSCSPDEIFLPKEWTY